MVVFCVIILGSQPWMTVLDDCWLAGPFGPDVNVWTNMARPTIQNGHPLSQWTQSNSDICGSPWLSC